MQFLAAQNGGGEDSKSFLKLKDKESVRGVFRGDPYDFKKHWTGTRSEVCLGQGCALCAADPGKKPSFRFRINILVKDEKGAYVSKIFEQGWTVYLQLADLHKVYPLDKTVMRITRSGSGQNDTHYSILPEPRGDVTPQMEALFSKVPLQVLHHGGDVTPSHQPEQPPHPVDSEPPFIEEDLPF